MLTRTVQVAKKLVNSDFKNNRVDDPTKITEKQQKKVKQFCKEYFDKAVIKHRAHEKKKAAKQAKEPESKPEDTPNALSDEALDVKMSDDEDDKADDKSAILEAEDSGGSLKRKRDDKENGTLAEIASPSKRPKSSTPTPPPPPPMTPGEGSGEELKQDEKDPIDIKPEHENDELATVNTPPPPPPPPATEDPAENHSASLPPKEKNDTEAKEEIKPEPDT